MTLASACPNKTQLGRLIDGQLPEIDLQRLTDHVEICTICQDSLDTIASGEIPVRELAEQLDELNPPEKSAYWKAISNIELGSDDTESKQDQDTPDDVASMLTRTQTLHGFERSSRASSTDRPKGLDFLSPSDDPAYIGQLHHFQVSRVIGRGGMGIVLEAFDTHLHRTVAIKVLNPHYQESDIARQRFCREGRAAAAISHEHVVAMHQVAHATEDDVAYLVMQYIDGDTLDQRLADSQPMPTHEVARIGMQIAAGLTAAHARGMVHRDIKPANVLIEKETERVKLTDFGLARATDDVKLTQTGMVTGTPLYMSPEQALGGTADERSDLFSVGAVLYEMATGQPAFAAPTAVGVMKRIMDETPQPPHQLNPEIPKLLSKLIMSLLEKKPEKRPESSLAVAATLAEIVTGFGAISPLQIPSIASSPGNRIANTHRLDRRRWLMGSGMLAGGAAIAVASMSIGGWSPGNPDPTDVSKNFPSIVLAGNPGTVWSVDFSTDGNQIAAAIEDGTVRLWDLETQQVIKSFNAHRGIVWKVEYHPTRPLVVTSGDDGFVKLWDSQSFELKQQWNIGTGVRSVAFSPNGRRLAAGDKDGHLHIIDLDTLRQVNAVAQGGSIYGVDYSADGKLIATVSSDKIVRLYDADTLNERQTLIGHDGPIYNVTFHESGPLLASVGWNKSVKLWNSETGVLEKDLVGSTGDVWGAAFCGLGSHLVTSDHDGAVRLWNIEEGKIDATLRGHDSAVHNISLDSIHHRIATSSRDGTVRVWDMSSLNKHH